MIDDKTSSRRGKKTLLGVTVAFVCIAAVVAVVLLAGRTGTETLDSPPPPQPLDNSAAPLPAPVDEAESLDEEMLFEINDDITEIMEARAGKAEREEEIRTRIAPRVAIPRFSPNRDPLAVEKQANLYGILSAERALSVEKDVEIRTRRRMDAARYYQGIANLTVYEDEPAQHTEYQQKALDHIFEANKNAKPEAATSLAYHVAVYVKSSMQREHAASISLDGVPVSWELALEWCKKAEDLWNSKPEEKRNEKTAEWYPQSSLLLRGKCLMALERTQEALELFDKLKEEYPEHDQAKARLKRYLQQPDMQLYYSRYFTKQE